MTGEATIRMTVKMTVLSMRKMGRNAEKPSVLTRIRERCVQGVIYGYDQFSQWKECTYCVTDAIKSSRIKSRETKGNEEVIM